MKFPGVPCHERHAECHGVSRYEHVEGANRIAGPGQCGPNRSISFSRGGVEGQDGQGTHQAAKSLVVPPGLAAVVRPVSQFSVGDRRDRYLTMGQFGEPFEGFRRAAAKKINTGVGIEQERGHSLLRRSAFPGWLRSCMKSGVAFP